MSLRGCFFSSFASVASFAVKYLFLVFLRFSARFSAALRWVFPEREERALKSRVRLLQPVYLTRTASLS